MAEGPSASRKKDKNQHIQVFVRVRPTNHAESVGRSSTVVEVPSTKEVVVRERPQDKLTKKFTFDKVFGPSSKQVDVYTSVVSPLLDEVLAGYNCTVFAYGQTGTGKTFTMEGVDNDPSIHWKSDSNAGIIPRALSHLFDELRMLENHEFTVRVSFLELYNEELFDLLSPTDEPQSSKIRIYEDAAKKGAVIIHGLEEVTVHSKSEVYKILEKGSEQRKTSATLMNAHSSRSHTVFSITIHIKENTVEGEELIKIGKLNLVDLAGSENVGRSGAVKRRAMEAGNINQSLLTLGRVITALVERAPHIPYRESKLTRLLQESLGGRTKTSIIATVSPAGINLEETLSTLDYAHRAKNITNRPEINQKLSKRELLKEYTEEIERLRRDLQATRERNGVYIAQDNYNEMQSTIEAQGKEIEEKINHIKALEDKMMVNENTLKDLKMDLENTKQEVKITKQQRDEREHLVLAHVATEKKLTSQAQTLLNVAKDASTDVAKLHDKIERKRKIEEENASLGEEFHDNITQQLNDIQENFSSYSQDIVQFCLSSKDQLNNLTQNITQGIEQSIEIISHDLVNNQQSENERLETHVKSCNQLYKKWLDESIEKTVNLTEHETELLRCFFLKFSPKITELVETSVADNLKKINEDNSIKMDLLMNLMKTTVDKLSSKLLIDRDRMEERITTVSKISDDEIAATKNIMNEKEEFFKEFQAFTKKYKNLYDEDKNIAETIIQKSTDTIDICENIKTDIQQTYADVINIKKFVDENVSSTVDEIKQDLSTGLEVNWKIAENSIDLSKKLAEEMKKDLKNNCDILEKFKDTTESRINEFKAQIEADKSTTLVSTKNITEIVSESSVEHKELMNNHKNSMGINVGEIIRKFEDKSGDSIEWNDNLSSSVGSIKNHIGKFIVQDLRKYEPTGSTPAKKDFRYPSQLVSTSPHERIIRRFRQNPIVAVETALGNEAMDTSLVDGDERMKFASLTPCDVKSKNTPSIESLTRAASTSNLSTAAAAGHEPTTIVRSISDITKKQDNKENSDNEFLKPDIKTNKSTLSKLKYCPKKILSSHND